MRVSLLETVRATPLFLLIVKLKNVSVTLTLMVAAAPVKMTVPLLSAKVPPAV